MGHWILGWWWRWVSQTLNEYSLGICQDWADRLLNIMLVMLMGLVDIEWIFTMCNLGLGGWAIEYYVDDSDGLGGRWMDMVCQMGYWIFSWWYWWAQWTGNGILYWWYWWVRQMWNGYTPYLAMVWWMRHWMFPSCFQWVRRILDRYSVCKGSGQADTKSIYTECRAGIRQISHLLLY